MMRKRVKDRNIETQGAERQGGRQYGRLMAAILVILAATWYVSTFWYQLMLIQGKSMEPSFHSWQLVVLDKQPGEPGRGDVIAFHCDSLQAVLVKRVVALPGDSVLIKDGVLYINGEPDKTLPGESCISYAGIAAEELVLSEEEYFVLGDNLEYSKDSRYEEIGCIQKSDIIGRIL